LTQLVIIFSELYVLLSKKKKNWMSITESDENDSQLLNIV
jgi:hypothetical protein